MDRYARAVAVSSLLALGLGLQIYFFSHYPQPPLFGDPVHYLDEGRRWQQAFRELRGGAGLHAAFETLRPGLLFTGVGLLYAVMDGLRAEDARFFRLVFAAFNTFGMLGAFCLGRTLSGTFAGGLAALALAAVHPSFATHTARMYPDPVTGCFFVWATFAFVHGVVHRRARSMAASGFVLMLALLVRSQLLKYVLGLFAVALLISAVWWWRQPAARRLAAAFVAGVLPLLAVWLMLTAVVGRRGEGLHGHLGLDLKQVYPYGFWQYLDTDGWEGPFRLRTDPFYKALHAEAQAGDPELLRSRPRQAAFTVRYVWSRLRESVLLVLDNAYRLYDRPANPYQRDFPFGLEYQNLYQKAILLASACALAAFAGGSPALAGAFAVPLALAIIHGLAFPWPRYGFPAYLTILGGAGAFVGWLSARRDSLRLARPLLILAAVAALLLAAGAGLRDIEPEGARAARLVGTLAALALPFAFVAQTAGTRRAAVIALGVWLGCGALVTAHELRGHRWHETRVVFGQGTTLAVEQEIHLSAEARGRIRTASEAFVVFDMQVPRGDLRGASVTVGTKELSEPAPTMPRLREGTATGGRDRRAYPQWWAVRLPAELVPRGDEPLRVRLTVPPDAVATLGADRFRGQQRAYEGPSFGDWPYTVAGKLEYDGEYRISVRRALSSASTRSFVVGADGGRRPLRGVLRIRVLTLDRNEGGLTWDTAPMPGAALVAAGFAAYSGQRGEADLLVAGRRLLSFPLGASVDFQVEAPPYRLCHRGQGLRSDKPYGVYALIGPAEPGTSARLAVRFRTGMSLEPRFFQIDSRRDRGEIRAIVEACDAPGAPFVDGVQTIVDAARNNYPEDTGRWTVDAVF